MIVNKVDKKVKVSKDDVIKYQILTHCFFTGIQVSDSDLDCLTELAKQPNMELSRFCEQVTDKGIFKSSQSSRNSITKSIKKGLVEKNGKLIRINKDLAIQSDGVILLDFKILGNETKES